MKSFVLSIPALVAGQSQPTFPPQYSCSSMYTLNGTEYGEVVHIDQAAQARVEVKTASRTIFYFANTTKYAVTASWCSTLKIYDHFNTEPPMAAAYTYQGEKTMDGVDCDVFGENDQWADHMVYFKKGTWVPVAVYDKLQESTGMAGGLTHYSNCKEGLNATVYDVPASCFKAPAAPFAKKAAPANGQGCCGTSCSSNGDCAANLFCCPNHLECMGDDTKSTAGPDCDACNPSSAPVATKLCNTVVLEAKVKHAAAATTHYGDPLAGACMADEQNITITGVAGSVCSPAATGILKQKCPTDTPAGCTITPAAILQDQSGDKYCALECTPSLPIKDQKLADAICGVDNMSCKPISGVGICTYDA